MFYQKPCSETKEGEIIKLTSNDVAAKIIKEYEEIEMTKQREVDAK